MVFCPLCCISHVLRVIFVRFKYILFEYELNPCGIYNLLLSFSQIIHSGKAPVFTT